MHVHLPTLSETATVRDAVDKMDIYQFPALVFVGSNLRLLGVITEGDLARAAQRAESVLRIASDQALIYGTRDPFTCSPDTEIGEALHAMLSRGLTILPVVEGDHFAGIVLRVDLMHAIILDGTSPNPGP